MTKSRWQTISNLCSEDGATNTRRQLLVVLAASALLVPFDAFAQQNGKVWHIGYLDFSTRKSFLASGRYAALVKGMGTLGYVEGKNFVLEERFANGNSRLLGGLAAELVRQKVDVILSRGTPAHHAAQRATSKIPIVVVADANPVGNGLAASLARPGANITGMSTAATELIQKLVEMLITAFPKTSRIAVLANPASGSHATMLRRIKVFVEQRGRQLLPVNVRTPEDIEHGFKTMVDGRADAAITLIDAFLFQQRRQIAELAIKHRLPSIFPISDFARAGGLMSYGADVTDNYRRAATFMDKIFKGQNAGDIPFELPTRYYLLVNDKTAKAIGVKIPAELMMRADDVIE